GATTTIFVMDEQNVCMETDSSGVAQAIYVDLPGIWGGKFSQRRGSTSRIYLPDFQGNVRKLTDVAQTVQDTLIPDAWGIELATTGATVYPYRVFGQWGYVRDSANQLYVRARPLRSDLGR